MLKVLLVPSSLHVKYESSPIDTFKALPQTCGHCKKDMMMMMMMMHISPLSDTSQTEREGAAINTVLCQRDNSAICYINTALFFLLH